MKPLSRNDIVALKQADHVIFSSIYMHGRNNIGTITCAKQLPNEEFKTWEITLTSSVQFLHDNLIETNCVCQFLIYNSFVNWTWQTIAGMLLPGDELELIWQPDAESTVPLIDAGFHCDLLKIVAFRKQQRFHHIVGVLVEKEIDLRMIKGLNKIPTKEMLTL